VEKQGHVSIPVTCGSEFTDNLEFFHKVWDRNETYTAYDLGPQESHGPLASQDGEVPSGCEAGGCFSSYFRVWEGEVSDRLDIFCWDVMLAFREALTLPL
jgi:hypothetical protein